MGCLGGELGCRSANTKSRLVSVEAEGAAFLLDREIINLSPFSLLNNQESLPEILMDADDLKKIDELFRRHVDGVKEDVKHHMGIMTEDFQHKLDIVVEGHQMLSDKIDRVEDRLDRVEVGLKRVEVKVDAVAADLSAHRADTEAHHGVYRVRDCGE